MNDRVFPLLFSMTVFFFALCAGSLSGAFALLIGPGLSVADMNEAYPLLQSSLLLAGLVFSAMAITTALFNYTYVRAKDAQGQNGLTQEAAA